MTVTVAGSYSVEWSLLDPDNNVMVTISTMPDTRNVAGFLEPTTAPPLQPGVLYRLRVRLPAVVGTSTGLPGRTYLHFTGTDPLSIDRNALTEIASVTIDRDWILEPNATNSTIPVTVGYKVHRSDRRTTKPQNVDIEATLTPRMTNDVSSAPVLAPVQLASIGGGSFSISVDWPPAYANAIDVMIHYSPDLIEWFLPNPAPHIGSGEFREIFSNSNPRFFYRAFPALSR